jgi:hypothetical protein
MEGSDSFERFARAGFERLGVELDETQMAIVRVAEAVYGPHIAALMEADLSGVRPELEMDLSRAPNPE